MVSSEAINPLLDWAPAANLEDALDHVRLARSVLVRMQEALEAGRLAADGRAYGAAARNVQARVRRALELGAKDGQVLAAAAGAYRSDLCEKCRCIYYTKSEDPRFSGLCGDCLYAWP